jgi:D-proline reductase (dithiol) PrdB
MVGLSEAGSLNLWEPSERDRKALEKFVSLAGEAHSKFRFTWNRSVHRASLAKPLGQATLALVTTAGVHLRSDEPFDLRNPLGDPSYRLIPFDAGHDDLMITDHHFNSEGAAEDINCLFPTERVRVLHQQGVIGRLAETHYGFMGFNPRPDPPLLSSAARVAERLAADGIDVVLMTPG